MTLEDLLIKTVETEASDLHVTVGTPPRIRKNGSLLELGEEKLSADKVKELIESKMSKKQIEHLMHILRKFLKVLKQFRIAENIHKSISKKFK